jgi:hypothetical protein
MAYAVYKYEIQSADFTVKVPKDSSIYKFAVQGQGNLVFWARVNLEEKEMVTRRFKSYETGKPIEPMKYAQDYQDTVELYPGYIVHVFEVVIYAPYDDEEGGTIR